MNVQRSIGLLVLLFPVFAFAGPAKPVEKKAVDDFFSGISRDSAKSTGLGIRFDYDAATFSALDEDGVKGMKEATRSAEYALRVLANKDDAWKKAVSDKVKKVVVVGGKNEPASDPKSAWRHAEDAERAAKKKLAPIDPAFDANVRAAKYGQFLKVSLNGDTLVLACQMKNCVHASMGTFPINDDVKHLLK